MTSTPFFPQLFSDAIKLAVAYKQNSGDFMDEVMRELEVREALCAAPCAPWRGWHSQAAASREVGSALAGVGSWAAPAPLRGAGEVRGRGIRCLVEGQGPGWECHVEQGWLVTRASCHPHPVPFQNFDLQQKGEDFSDKEESCPEEKPPST